MSILRTARSLLDLGIDAAEALLYAVFDFDRQADELWADRLADKEAEEEVSEPAWTDPGDVVETRLEKAGRDAYRKYFTGFATSSVADPSPEATDERRGGSIPNHDVEPPRSPNLDTNDLLDAAFACRAYAGRCTRDEIAAKWHRLGRRLFDAAK